VRFIEGRTEKAVQHKQHVEWGSRIAWSDRNLIRVRPSPIRDHPVADIAVKTQRRRTTRPAVCAPTTAPSTILREIIRAGARVPGPLIAGDAVLQAPEISEAAE
jgi:hypothetical protein